MFSIKCNFIGDYKLGDNINYNLRVLNLLYSIYNNTSQSEKNLLHKPIIVLNVSIIEALLHDLHYRIYTFTTEGVANITDEIRSHIFGKKIDKLEKYIASARKHNFFSTDTDTLYDALENLRKLRNRVHIQNEKKHFEKDDANAFTRNRMLISEQVLEIVIITMSIKFPRNNQRSFVDPFVLPWASHWLNSEKPTNNRAEF